MANTSQFKLSEDQDLANESLFILSESSDVANETQKRCSGVSDVINKGQFIKIKYFAITKRVVDSRFTQFSLFSSLASPIA